MRKHWMLLPVWLVIALVMALPTAVATAQPLPFDPQQEWDDAFELFRNGQYDAAADKFIELAKKVPPSEFQAAALYNAACAYSLKGDKRKGAVWFAHSVRAGFRDAQHIATDSDLDNIRREPLYEHVMKLVRERKFGELDQLDVAALEQHYYAPGQQPAQPAQPGLTPEQRAKLDALRKELYGQIENELDALRKRLREQVDQALAELGAGTATPTPGPVDPTPPVAGGATLGLSVKELTPSLREFLGVPEGQGLIVMEVEANGPAAQAGIAKLDVLLSIAGRSVGSMADFERAVNALRAGQAVEVVVQRANEKHTIRVTPVGKGEATPAPPPVRRIPYRDGGYLGLSLAADDNGLRVGAVTPDSPAAKAGIQPGDVIAKVNGAAITDTTKLRDALQQTFIGDTIEIVVNRQGRELALSLTIGQRPR